MIDAAYAGRRIGVKKKTTDLGVEIAGTSMPHDCVSPESINLRQTRPHREAVQLGFSPGDGEGNRSVPKRVEVERIVRVLPEIVGVHDQIPAQCLLKTGIKL